MSAAAPDSKRKAPQKAPYGKRTVPFAKHELVWEQHKDDYGFFQLPLTVRHVVKLLTEVQSRLFWYVVLQTVGERTNGVKPESVVLSDTRAATIAGCTRNGAANALHSLVAGKALKSERVKGGTAYSLDMDGWQNLDTKAFRKLKLVEPPTDPDVDGAGEDDDKASRVVKTTEPMVILPGPKSKPQPLSSVCKSAASGGCGLMTGGECTANNAANKHTSSSGVPTPVTGEEEAKAHAVWSHLKIPLVENLGIRYEALVSNMRAASYVDGVLTVGVLNQVIVDDMAESGPKAAIDKTLSTRRVIHGIEIKTGANVTKLTFVCRYDLFADKTAARAASAPAPVDTLREEVLRTVKRISAPLPASEFERAREALHTPDELFLDVLAERSRKGNLSWKLLPHIAADATRRHLQNLGLYN